MHKTTHQFDYCLLLFTLSFAYLTACILFLNYFFNKYLCYCFFNGRRGCLRRLPLSSREASGSLLLLSRNSREASVAALLFLSMNRRLISVQRRKCSYIHHSIDFAVRVLSLLKAVVETILKDHPLLPDLEGKNETHQQVVMKKSIEMFIL